MILSGHQPEYLPYLGFFNKMLQCDKFILVDHIQYVKKDFHNRNRIATKEGPVWLSIPVITKGKSGQRICDVEINNNLPWQEKHWKTIYFNYKNSPYFKDYSDFFEKIYSKKFEKLAELNEEIIKFLAKSFDINMEIEKTSKYNIIGKRTDLLISLCKTFNAGTYVSGEGAKNYVDESMFKENNLKHAYRKFTHPIYLQRFKPFTPNMSAIDLLFNCGRESIKILKKSVV